MLHGADSVNATYGNIFRFESRDCDTASADGDYGIDVALPSPCFEAADVAERVGQILVDSGSSHDLISEFVAAMFPESQCDAPPVRLNTANGIVTARHGLHTNYPLLGGEDSMSYVLSNTPAVMSVGKRCMRSGHSYIWVAGKRPVFWMPDGRIAILAVKRSCPYLNSEVLIVNPSDDCVFDLTGIRVDGEGY